MTIATITPIIGANIDRVTSKPDFALGTAAQFGSNLTGIYVKFSGTVAASTAVVALDASYNAAPTGGDYSTTSTFNGAVNGQYGWVTRPTTA